jgi:hypothetical protein
MARFLCITYIQIRPPRSFPIPPSRAHHTIYSSTPVNQPTLTNPKHQQPPNSYLKHSAERTSPLKHSFPILSAAQRTITQPHHLHNLPAPSILTRSPLLKHLPTTRHTLFPLHFGHQRHQSPVPNVSAGCLGSGSVEWSVGVVVTTVTRLLVCRHRPRRRQILVKWQEGQVRQSLLGEEGQPRQSRFFGGEKWETGCWGRVKIGGSTGLE